MKREINLTAETAAASSVHHPFGKPGGPGLWHMKDKQLPAYMQNVAHALIRSGSAKDESDAIHKAVGIVKKWATGRSGGSKKVTPDVQAAAQKAVAEWYQLRGERGARTGAKSFHMANDHHDSVGKFAGLTKERTRILKMFQEQHQLPVTGTIDEETRARLNEINKAAND